MIDAQMCKIGSSLGKDSPVETAGPAVEGLEGPNGSDNQLGASKSVGLVKSGVDIKVSDINQQASAKAGKEPSSQNSI
jgi:hypothetical protein